MSNNIQDTHNFLPTLRTRIKICGLTRHEDVLAAVNAGADAVGFVLYPKSARYVTPAQARLLAQRLPPFVVPVLLFVNATALQIHAMLKYIPHAMLQFHGDETPAFCKSFHRPYIRAARIPLGEAGKSFDLQKYSQNHASAQAILLDAHIDGYGGGGQTFDWHALPAQLPNHTILSGGLNTSNVAAGVMALLPRCQSLSIDVSSGVEVVHQKGIKDIDKIYEFIGTVRQADEAFWVKALQHSQGLKLDA